MKRNRYPILFGLRVCLYVLAAIITLWCGNLVFNLVALWNSKATNPLVSENEGVLAFAMGFSILEIFGCVIASVVLVFFAEMIKLVCDIQRNTWETANEIKIFTKASKQQTPEQRPPNPPDSQFQISVD